MKFKYFTDQEIIEAIKTLEQALAQGISNASYSGGGSIQYTTQANMKETLKHLYKTLEERETGTPRPKIRKVLFSNNSKGL